jgi:phenylacetate-coenzyme A ligase PaaK-like adenylate-forming protein
MNFVKEKLDKLLLEPSPYTLGFEEKSQLFSEVISYLSEHHLKNCVAYKKIIESSKTNQNLPPALAVRLFKNHELRSINRSDIIKTLTSSGTTSQAVSRIFLDKDTSIYQTKVLVHIMQSFLGKQRLPMLIIDHPGVIKNRQSFSARGAGILGLSNFGRKHTYALYDDMQIDFEKIENFLINNRNQPIFVFGFTFMVWQYFIQHLKNENKSLNIPDGILVHSGGWKKLQDQAVDNKTFKKSVQEFSGISKIHDFYGMVEQVGSIYVECENGYLHASNFSDLVIRDPFDWKELPIGERGVIEVHSLLPMSYPGHVLLTEDLGTIIGIDDCPCGRKGKYFYVHGRVPKAEIRGCSDTHTGS